jgi:hypothetical protein
MCYKDKNLIIKAKLNLASIRNVVRMLLSYCNFRHTNKAAGNISLLQQRLKYRGLTPGILLN